MRARGPVAEWVREVWSWEPQRATRFDALRVKLLWRGLWLAAGVTALSSVFPLLVDPVYVAVPLLFATTMLLELALLRAGQDLVAVVVNLAVWLVVVVAAWGPTGGLDGTIAPFLVVGAVFCASFLNRTLAVVGVAVHLVVIAGDQALRGWFTRELWVQADAILAMRVSSSAIAVVVASIFTGMLYQALQRAEAEAQQRAADATRAEQAARRASQQKARFLATMSHELRTPLNAILGYTDLLLDDTPGDLDLKRIRTSGRGLLELVDDVLEVARAESGEAPNTPAPLGEVIGRLAHVQLESTPSAAAVPVAFSSDVLERMVRNLGGAPATPLPVRARCEGDALVLELPRQLRDPLQEEIAMRLAVAHGATVETCDLGWRIRLETHPT